MKNGRPAAEKNVKSYLITEKLIEVEKIEVSDEEVDEEIKKQAESAGMSYEDTKNYFEQERNAPIPLKATSATENFLIYCLSLPKSKKGPRKIFWT